MFYQRSEFNTNPGDYKIHTYDKIHEYNHVHEYKRIHGYDKIHKYDKIHEYNHVHQHKYEEYKPTRTVKKRVVRSDPQPRPMRPKRKRKSSNDWVERKIFTHTYRPYEYIPPPHLRHYEYKSYKTNNEDYLTRQIHMYDGWTEYKLTPDNYPPFRHLKSNEPLTRKSDINNNEKTVHKRYVRNTKIKPEEKQKPLSAKKEKVPRAATVHVVNNQSPIPYKSSSRLPSPEVVVSCDSPSPILPPIVAPVVIRSRQQTKETQRASSINHNSPKTSRHIQTRSPSPNLAPISAAIFTNRVINPDRTDQSTEVRPKSTKEYSSPEKTKTKSGSPDVATGVILGAVVGENMSKTQTNNSSPKPQSTKQRTPTPSRSPSLMEMAAITAVSNTQTNNSSPKPQQTKQRTPTPSRSPSLVEMAAITTVVNKEASNDNLNVQNSPVPSKSSSTKSLKTQPVKSPSLNDAAIATAVVVSSGNNHQGPAKQPAKEENATERRPIKADTPDLPKPAIAATVTKTLKPRTNPDNPSAFSSLPNRTSLPPEVIATIVAYDRAHGA